jgi:hypothetical protein
MKFRSIIKMGDFNKRSPFERVAEEVCGEAFLMDKGS